MTEIQNQTHATDSRGSPDANGSAFWTLLFETDDGQCHPLRIEYAQPVPQSQVMMYAAGYLLENRWLSGVSDVYPTKPND